MWESNLRNEIGILNNSVNPSYLANPFANPLNPAYKAPATSPCKVQLLIPLRPKRMILRQPVALIPAKNMAWHGT